MVGDERDDRSALVVDQRINAFFFLLCKALWCHILPTLVQVSKTHFRRALTGGNHRGRVLIVTWALGSGERLGKVVGTLNRQSCLLWINLLMTRVSFCLLPLSYLGEVTKGSKGKQEYEGRKIY